MQLRTIIIKYRDVIGIHYNEIKANYIWKLRDANDSEHAKTIHARTLN